MPRPKPTRKARTALAREIFVSFVSSPLFAEQLNEDAEDDHLPVLGYNTAVDAFALADAFLECAAKLKP